MKAQQKSLALIVGGTLAATVAMAPASAAGNPFALKPLAAGYMVAENHDGGEKMQDGKCGSGGKCGSSMKKKAEKAKEGSCSGEKKAKEGSCSSNKNKEGNCSAEKKGKDGSCSSEKK